MLKKICYVILKFKFFFQKSCSHFGAKLGIVIDTFTLIGFVLFVDSGTFENITLTLIPNSILEILICSFKQLKS